MSLRWGPSSGRPRGASVRSRHIDFIRQGKTIQMNKSDLVATAAVTAGVSQADAASVIDATFDAITAVLKSGGEVRLLGFGSFSVANRAARQGHNPATGAKIQIAASKQPRFKAGKGLKEALND